ncbi:adenine-specific DNA-methyltransferase [uncultured Gammaproteobacteria bacterium]
MNVTRTYSIVVGLATWFWGMIMGVMALTGVKANGSSEAATRRWFAIGAGAMLSLLPLVAQADISVPALNYDEAKARMAGLVAKFDARYAEVMSKHFSEHRDREEFIDEFFAILGWDVDNVRAAALYAEDTIPEMRMRIGTTMHYADYGFRVASRTVFIAEAKGASHNIDDPHYIYQAKRYAWSSMRGNLAVLTDFETFRVYDARVRPDFDHPKQGELARFHLTYHDYVANFDLLWKTLSHQAVVEGSVQRLLEETDPHLKRVPVGEAFLDDLEAFRLALGRDLHANNPDLDEGKLSEAAHHILNMLVFARILEDRDIEPTGRLREVVDVWRAAPRDRPLYSAVLEEMQRFRKRYRSIMFGAHFSQGLKLGDQVLTETIEQLYPPRSPYEFSIIPVSVLGKAYENYLGRRLEIEEGQVRIADRPEVRKAGGVFYTPEWVASYIVDRALGPKLEGLTPDGARKLKLLDLACGSGAFTVRLADRLFRFAESWYAAHPEAIQDKNGDFPDAYRTEEGRWKLSVRKKAELVQDSVYCLDVDRQATEITMMWLFILILVDEGSPIVTEERHYRVPNRDHARTIEKFELPNLSSNIVWANVLIGPDFSEDPRKRSDARAFDWSGDNARIAGIVAAGGFDVVVSNPPYLSYRHMKTFIPDQIDYLRKTYASMADGQPDLSFAFVEKGQTLLKQDGRLGYIVSNRFIVNDAGENLRTLINEAGTLSELTDFGTTSLFDDAIAYVAVLGLHKGANPAFRYAKVTDIDDPQTLVSRLGLPEYSGNGVEVQTLPALAATSETWAFPPPSRRKAVEAMLAQPLRLEAVADSFSGMITGADKVFVVEERRLEEDKIVVFSKATGREHAIERQLLRPVVRARDVHRYQIIAARTWMVLPYQDGRLLTEDELRSRYPGAWNYLGENKDTLSNRSRGNGPWYAPSSVNRRFFGKEPKLLTGWRQGPAQFTLDETGGILFTGSSRTAAVVPTTPDIPITALLGILNSDPIRKVAATTGKEYQGGLAWSASVLDQIPIVPVTGQTRPLYEAIAAKVRAILPLPVEAVAARESLENDIDRLVEQLYGIESRTP